ncbi:MAG: VWA domain-containing protein [Dehalococcoidales bacterium]|nr:VWA domain-containing protein [Dehalococcoidales bacterium]
MFTDFFYLLRKKKVPVSITEWMTLMEALSRGLIRNTDDFYFLARAILVKSEAYYDHYDVAFQEYFHGIEPPPELFADLMKWLEGSLDRIGEIGDADFSDPAYLDKLMKELEKRLQEQTEQHDGGSYWIGRGGTSPFGHSGYHNAGIRIGGEGGGRRALKIAQARRFRNYRSDLTLDVRQIKIALKGLRQLSRIGNPDELDLDETIDATAKNCGDIDLRWRRSRKNAAKVLLLMDAGGSMDPYASLCSQLFSAAHTSSHFKDFKYYYFHNCIYDYVFKDMERMQIVNTGHLLRTLEPDYKVIVVGDARMALWELTQRGGAIEYYQINETPGITWLKRFTEHFSHYIWLNPDNTRFWVHPTTQRINKLFPMYPLTIEGINQAVKKLVVKK